MDDSSLTYSAVGLVTPAQALRTAGVGPVREALLAARQRTLSLADAYQDALGTHGMQVPYSPAVNPPLWELGHIGWFQEYWIDRNRQRAAGADCDPEHERAGSLLTDADALYDSGRVAHRTRWELALPDAATTRDYLARTLASTLDTLDGLSPDASHDELYFFRLVALHEEMHAEAAAYMAGGLAVPWMVPQPPSPAKAVALRVPAQSFRMGWSGAGFAFDNELCAHDVEIAAFEIDAQPMTWSRYMPFVQAGGYHDRRWWTDAGWAWLQAAGSSDFSAEAGAFAVHLNAHEAEAWCRWAGRRLPTEAQWECAALGAPHFSWGQAWEWTATPFGPYPGFRAHPYRDYSAPWFGTRRVLRGACAATSPILAHPRYRNFFEPHRRDVFAGFRSCAGADGFQ